MPRKALLTAHNESSHSFGIFSDTQPHQNPLNRTVFHFFGFFVCRLLGFGVCVACDPIPSALRGAERLLGCSLHLCDASPKPDPSIPSLWSAGGGWQHEGPRGAHRRARVPRHRLFPRCPSPRHPPPANTLSRGHPLCLPPPLPQPAQPPPAQVASTAPNRGATQHRCWTTGVPPAPVPPPTPTCGPACQPRQPDQHHKRSPSQAAGRPHVLCVRPWQGGGRGHGVCRLLHHPWCAGGGCCWECGCLPPPLRMV